MRCNLVERELLDNRVDLHLALGGGFDLPPEREDAPELRTEDAASSEATSPEEPPPAPSPAPNRTESSP